METIILVWVEQYNNGNITTNVYPCINNKVANKIATEHINNAFGDNENSIFGMAYDSELFQVKKTYTNDIITRYYVEDIYTGNSYEVRITEEKINI